MGSTDESGAQAEPWAALMLQDQPGEPRWDIEQILRAREEYLSGTECMKCRVESPGWSEQPGNSLCVPDILCCRRLSEALRAQHHRSAL